MAYQGSVSGVSVSRRWWLWIIGLMILLFLILPSVLVVVMSFSDSAYLEFPPRSWSLRWYENYLQSIAWQDATVTSLLVACLTTLVATPTGTAAAYGLYATSLPLKSTLNRVFLLPLIFPHILMAIGIFYVYVIAGLNATAIGLVLAHSVLAIPLVYLTMAARMRSYDFTQERAARSLGASRLFAFRTVILPQIKFSVITAALLAFITSLDEVVIGLFISGGDRTTLTKVMFVALRDQIDPTIAAVSTCLIIASTVGFVLSQLGGRTTESASKR